MINNFEEIKPNIIEKMLRFLLPKSNSLNFSMDSILYWYLEFEELEIKREIAFNNERVIIYKAPTKDNYGIWCDSLVNFKDIESYEEINMNIFESHWELLHD